MNGGGKMTAIGKCTFTIFFVQNIENFFGEGVADDVLDWVDPLTAEVQPVNGLQHVLIEHCAKQPDFLAPGTPLVDLIFRVFLANGNTPLSHSN